MVSAFSVYDRLFFRIQSLMAYKILFDLVKTTASTHLRVRSGSKRISGADMESISGCAEPNLRKNSAVAKIILIG
jgi:hypothetical protein